MMQNSFSRAYVPSHTLAYATLLQIPLVQIDLHISFKPFALFVFPKLTIPHRSQFYATCMPNNHLSLYGYLKDASSNQFPLVW